MKHLNISMILIMLMSMVGVEASAHDFAVANADGVTIYYVKTSDTEVAISFRGDYRWSNSNEYTGSVTIPKSVTYNEYTYAVTSISNDAFYKCSGLTSVTIPNSVTSIGSSAFSGCSGLVSITFPNSVTSIGNGAFGGCSGLTSVTIPNSVTSIGDGAFANCSGLTSITIPNSVTTIDSSTFFGCRVLTSVTIPNSVTSIGSFAFYGCSGLTSITIPNSVTIIDYGAFSNCSGLTSVTIPNSVMTIGGPAFSSCSGLTSINIPNSVTSIGDGAFENCSGLTSITIPNSVTTIGSDAFRNCSGLTSVTIPNSVTKIGSSAFSGCSGLTSITIPNSVTSIGNGAFSGCSVTSINIPNSMTSIDYGAFSGIFGLTSVTIPNSVTSIGESAFSSCSDLTSITIPNSVTSIGNFAFLGCSGLTSVTIPNSVTSIGESAFSSCSGLTSISVQSGNTKYDSRNNCNAIIETSSNKLIAGCKITIIPNSVTSIGSSAFYGCDGLTSITIPNSVTKIGDSAFGWCSGLTSITIPNSVTKIGDSAFGWCSGLTSVTIPNSVTSIGKGAFGWCSGLTSVTIPNSVTSIGNGTFRGCSGLTSVTIPNSVTNIGSSAFEYCPQLIVFCDRQTPPSAEDNSFGTGQLAIVPPDAAEAYRAATGWRNLFVNGAFITENITQTTVTLSTSEKFTNMLIKFGEQEFSAVDGKVKITGLKPNREYSFSAFAKYNGIDLENTITVQTKTVSLSCNVDRTNLTATIKGSYDAGDATVTKHGFVNMSDNVDEVTLNGLIPGESYTRTYYVECGEDCIFTKEISFSTIPVDVTINEKHGVTTCSLNGSYSVIDATVTGFGFIDNPGITEMKRKGLNPNTSYSYTFYVETKEGGRISKSVSFITLPLVLTTSQPKVVSLGNVIVAAESNIDDEEKNVGFEWRRTDWTDDFASNTGTANMFEGTMEGYICNLYTEKLWKFRPYYLSDDGTYYYGDWVGLDPTNTSYFEPTVHTYAKIEVKGNTALVKGYALGGSDKITVQGFKYWKKASANNRAASDIPSDAMTIEAKGTVMEVSLTDLEYASSYEYVAFATTSEGDTFYGEIKTFETGESPVTPGDANGDGNVNVTDIVEIVNYILGHPSDKFIFEAADVNSDGQVNVTDIVSVVNIILSSNARELTNRAAATTNLKLNGGNIKLRNAENYTAAQFDIHLTDGSTVNYLSLNSASDHQMTWKMVDANTCRVIVYSLSNAPFRTAKDELFNVTLSGNAMISNELLVNVDGMVTGINEMQFDKPVDVYDLRGNKVRSNTTDLNGLQKGVYIVNGKKVIVK